MTTKKTDGKAIASSALLALVEEFKENEPDGCEVTFVSGIASALCYLASFKEGEWPDKADVLNAALKPWANQFDANVRD